MRIAAYYSPMGYLFRKVFDGGVSTLCQIGGDTILSVFGSQVLELGEGGSRPVSTLWDTTLQLGRRRGGRGWVPASASSRGQDLDARTTGGGRAVRDPFLRSKGAGGRRRVPAFARTTGGGRAVRAPFLRGKGWGWVPACARTREGRLFVGNVGGDHPHPPSSRGQALTFPPSRGKGFVGAGRAVREPPLRVGRWQGWAAGLEGGGSGG